MVFEYRKSLTAAAPDLSTAPSTALRVRSRPGAHSAYQRLLNGGHYGKILIKIDHD